MAAFLYSEKDNSDEGTTQMIRIKIFVAAALLVAISGIASAIPSGPIANPEIYGEWKFDLTVDAGALEPQPKGDDDDDGECVFTGDLELRITIPIKENADKVSDPVFGDAQMELVSGPCGNFLGEIQGSAFNNTIFFNMAVFPQASRKGADKGDPLIILSLDGQLISERLMEGVVTGAIVPNPAKGPMTFGDWRATRSSMVPTLTPVGILALLAGLGLVGGIALRRRK